jgi:hypothetical protein
MTKDDPAHELHELLMRYARSPTAADDARDRLFELQNVVRDGIFDGNSLRADDPRLRDVLDALELLAVIEPDDPSHPWARGGALGAVGRHLEAASDFLSAADRFARVAEAEIGITGDEADWAESAREHAARHLVLGGQPASAAALLSSLSEESRGEIEALIERSLATL